MNPAENDRESLSPAAAMRRQSILADALGTADRRRIRRFVVRGTVVACAVGALAATLALLTQPHRPDTIVVESPHPAPTTTPVPTPPKVVVQIIRAGDVKPTWEVLSDDQFLAALADAGRPSGFVQLNGKSVIVPLRQ
jgi:hypothetical protein